MYLSLLSTYRVGSNYVMLRNVLKLIVLVRIFMVCVDHYQLIKIAVVANYSSVRQQLKILLKRSAYHLKRHLKVASAPSYRYMHPPQSHTFSLSCTTPPTLMLLHFPALLPPPIKFTPSNRFRCRRLARGSRESALASLALPHRGSPAPVHVEC